MDQNSTPQSKTLKAAGVLEFRVSRPGIPVRRLRLTGNRYTFGRDPAATVRLDDHSLQPVHALLLREIVGESERLVLQAMSVPLQVNGRLTTEATLHTGDTFDLGEFRFEFIGSIDAPETSSDPADHSGTQDPPETGGRTASEDPPAIRADGSAKPSSPRLSFAAGMRLVNEAEDAAGTDFPLRPERTLDAIEQALSSEADQPETTWRGTGLRQEIEQTLREESRGALERQKDELSQEHRLEMEKVLQRFAVTQAQAAAANRAIESMRQQVADLGRQLRSATEIKWEHQEALDRAGKERDTAREELRQASAQSQRLISELDAARRDRSEISSSLHDVTIQLYTATAEGDKAQSRARELVRQREDAFQKVESFAHRCEELSEQLRQAEQTCQMVSDQRDRFSEQLRQRTAERDSAITLADQRSDELTAKESVIDSLRSQVTELEQAVAESRCEAETLRAECRAACDSVAKLEEVVREGEQQRQADRASWEAESAELRASVEQISIELAAASTELTQSNETADALNAELAETRDALAEAESEVAMRPSVDELQTIRERLEATEQQLRRLQAETEVLEGTAEGFTENPTEAYADDPAQAYPDDPTQAYPDDPAQAYPDDPTQAYPDDPARAYAEDPAQAYGDDPARAYAEDPAQAYGDDPVQAYAEDPVQAYAEDPVQPYDDDPVQAYDDDPAQPYGEDAPESASNPPPWPVDLASPWNPDSSDLAASDQGDPLHTASDPVERDEFVDDEPAVRIDHAAESDSLPWQAAEGSEPPVGEEPNAGSFASELLKQLGDSEKRAEFAELTDPWAASEEASIDSTEEDRDAHNSAALEQGFGGHESFSDGYEYDGDAPQASVGSDDEPAMQESEIEQVREFLRSDDASAADETSCEDEASSQSDLGYGESSAFASPDAGAGDDELTGVAAANNDAFHGDHREEISIGSATCPAAAAGSEEDEDSIEAYMNRLLQRVQGGSSASYSPKPAPAPGSNDAHATPKETQKAAAPPSAEPEAPLDDDAPFVPRSQAPEKTKNLAAMRELANSSARTAIMSSVRKQAHNAAIQKFAQAAGCAVGATVMLYYSQLRLGWQMLAAICMTSLAAYWIIEAIQLQTHLRTETKRDSAVADSGTGVVQENGDAEEAVAEEETDHSSLDYSAETRTK